MATEAVPDRLVANALADFGVGMVTCLALAGGLAHVPTFTPEGYIAFASAIAPACAIAVLLPFPRLTPASRPGLPV